LVDPFHRQKRVPSLGANLADRAKEFVPFEGGRALLVQVLLNADDELFGVRARIDQLAHQVDDHLVGFEVRPAH